VVDVEWTDFEHLVEEAMATVPSEFVHQLHNVAVMVEDWSPAGGPELYGLYEGVPLTKRGNWYTGTLPDRITIYRQPILRHSRTRAEVAARVRSTVLHEIGHYFGIGDRRLHELGY
jgi:predicted Zn-dependent protease with MMP-like domain